ncbi:large tegument protein [Beluga whale alphaherpesvirus 1]|uniref:Large tegument protein n=1 Tax=Beluga whale alphaherpesvirus 1 TaxID=1434720 RepID=A0A286MM44_9ALPH|nr:large tegument protein [Beluga whale alphaherpesvirus 1]ASW27070.1 large tegument protein [Beluga whale alphaherpesvirus 1]
MARGSPRRDAAESVAVVAAGPRNQYAGDLGRGSGVSCLRSSLSFLRLVFTSGIGAAATPAGIDGALVEGQAWTAAAGTPPAMCPIVHLPNKITYRDSPEALCCVYSRVYGECGFYTEPGAGFLSTQVPAREFLEAVWRPHRTSYALVVIDAIGVAVFRDDDAVYVFDPHGYAATAEALVMRMRAEDLYPHLAARARADPESLWAAALVFFVSCRSGPDGPADIAPAVSVLYGVGETYLEDEPYVERSVAAVHPLALAPPATTAAVIGAPPPSPAAPDEGDPLGGGDAPMDVWAEAPGVAPEDPGGERPRYLTAARAAKAATLRRALGKRTSLPRRRRAIWTPATSAENVSARGPREEAGRPSVKYRRRSPPREDAGEGAGPPDPPDPPDPDPAAGGPEPGRARSPLALDVPADEDDVDATLARVARVDARIEDVRATLDRIHEHARLCALNAPWVAKPLARPQDRDPLEHAILLLFDRLLVFLVQNGTRTREDSPGAVRGLFAPLARALPVASPAGTFVLTTGMVLHGIPAYARLLDALRADPSHLGALIQAKLNMVAARVIRDTERFHAALSDAEAGPHGGPAEPPSGEYNALAARTLDSLSRFEGGLFSATLLRDGASLRERVSTLFVAARAEDARVRSANRSALRELEAVEDALREAGETLDAIRADDAVRFAGGEDAAPLEPPEARRRVARIREAAEELIRDAIADYFARGVRYSTQAILMDRYGGDRFRVAAAAVAHLERLAESLPRVDERLRGLRALEPLQGAELPRNAVAESRSARLLRGLLQEGRDLTSGQNLEAWSDLLREASLEGILEARDVEGALRDVAAINGRAERQSTLRGDVARFNVLSAAVEQAARDAEAAPDREDNLDTIARSAEEALRQARVLDGYDEAGLLPEETRQRVRLRGAEIELLLRATRQRALEARARRDEVHGRLGALLDPGEGFAALRAAPRALLDACALAGVEESELPRLLADAPPGLAATLRARAAELFDRYRGALSSPGGKAAPELAGLGLPFAVVFQRIFGYPVAHPAVVFFSDYSDRLVAAAAGLATPAEAEASLRDVARILRDADEALEALGPVPAEMGFVRELRRRYDARVEALRRAGALTAANADLLDAAAELAVAETRLRGPRAAGEAEDAAAAAASAETAARALAAARAAVGRFEALRTDAAPDPDPDAMEASHPRAEAPATPPLAVQKLLGEGRKSAALVLQRAAAVEGLLAAADAQRARLADARTEERWAADLQRALDRIETQSAFDAAELSRLLDVARARAFAARPLEKQAERALGAAAGRALLAVEAALDFNPYAPDNARLGAEPSLAPLRSIAWWPDYQASAPALAALFPGADLSRLALLHKISAGVLALAASGRGAPSHYDTVTCLGPDLLRIPALAKYVSFYRTGYPEFVELRERLGALRADVLQAAGSRPAEIARALEEVARVRDPRDAQRVLDDGVTLHLPSDALLRGAVSYLEKLDRAVFAGSAYEAYARDTVQRDLARAREAAREAAEDVADAKKRAVRLLTDVVLAERARERDDAAGLANLKNLLRVVPPPPSVAALLDRAASVDEIVTEAGLLLARVEATPELDVQALEWLGHARSVMDSHPLTARIDERGPMDAYADRLRELGELHDLWRQAHQQLLAAEAAWDAAWRDFEGARAAAGASREDYARAGRSLVGAQAATSVVAEIRGRAIYGRLPAKLVGATDAKFTARRAATDEYLAAARDTEEGLRALGALVAEIRTESRYERLVAHRRGLEERLARLPRWARAEAAPVGALLRLRLALYAEYARAFPAATLRGGRASPASPPGTDAGDAAAGDPYLRGRVAALLGDKHVIYTLREARSELDGLLPRAFLTEVGTPVAYTVCYPTVCEKLGVALCGEPGRAMRPPLDESGVLETATAAAVAVAHEVVALRLELERAAERGMETFSRFVRHGRADWDPADGRLAAAERYAALLATMLPQRFGAATLGALAFDADAREFRPRGAEPGRPAGGPARVLRLTPADALVAAASGVFAHLYNCVRLDLAQQHEYVMKTAGRVLAYALAERVAVDALDARDPRARPVPLAGPPGDPSEGGLFAIRPADWEQARAPAADPLALWRALPHEGVRAALRTVEEAVPGAALTAFTVLARMCIPADALAALWSVLATDSLGSRSLTYDRFVTARLDLPATVQAAVRAPPRTPGDDADDAVDGLYRPTGRSVTFTTVGQPPSDVRAVNAMDVVTCAILLGAPLVVAMEDANVFSEGSGLLMCVRLFDSRPGTDGARLGVAVSSDVASWGEKLLALDPSPIEDICLAAQLEHLSALIAAKPLAAAPPCLVTLDTRLDIARVLWPRPGGGAAGTVVHFVDDEAYADLPRLAAESDGDLLPPVDEADPLYSALITGGAGPTFADDETLYPMPPAFRHPPHDPFPFGARPPEDPGPGAPGIGPWAEWLDGDSDLGGAGAPAPPPAGPGQRRGRRRRSARRRRAAGDAEEGPAADAPGGDLESARGVADFSADPGPGRPLKSWPSRRSLPRAPSLSDLSDEAAELSYPSLPTSATSDSGDGYDSEGTVLSGGSRIATSNSMLRRRYVRGTGLSVLGTLIEACRRIALRLAQTRELLVENGAYVLSELFSIRLLIG